MVDFRKFLVMLVFAAVAVLAIFIIMKVIKKIKSAKADGASNDKEETRFNAQDKAYATPAVDTVSGPHIFISYEVDGGFLEDGKCGWLDVECEDGDEKTYKLNFNKKSPTPIIVPLKNATYRITYRTQSKAAMAASGVLNSINESNGAMGAFANAVYDAGGMNGELESVVVKVEDDFVLRLTCKTDGLTKSCRVTG